MSPFIQFQRDTEAEQNRRMSTTSTTEGRVHVLAYPFPSAGHVIPLMDLAKAIVSRGVTVTVLVTPSNQSLVPADYSPLLQTLLLPPIQNPGGVVSMVSFMRDHHYPILLDWARAHPSPPQAIISDFYLGWTHHLARDLHVPRLVFSPSGAFGLSVSFSLWRDLPSQNDDGLVPFPSLPNSPHFPWWQITHKFRLNKRGGPEWEFHRENMLLNLEAWGVVFNTFTELERAYLDHVKKELGHQRVWAVGPVLPEPADSGDRGGPSTVSCQKLITWLDSRSDGSVLYVCFGSRVVLTSSQMEVLTRALELSGVHFILSVRDHKEHVEEGHDKVLGGLADRVGERAFVVEGWAPQLVVLNHRAVGAFLTHCGWNSVLEGLISGVLMLTWPQIDDQYANAKLLVDQLGAAVRGAEGAENVPEASELARRIERSLEKKTSERALAEELKGAALSAIKDAGSSQKQLDQLVEHLSQLKNGQA